MGRRIAAPHRAGSRRLYFIASIMIDIMIIYIALALASTRTYAYAYIRARYFKTPS